MIGNTCYRNEEYVPFYAAGNITDGNGIIIDDSRNTQNGSALGVYVGKTYVANNLVFDNGGRGIHCYLADKVIIVNNTCYKNCQSPAINDGEFTAYSADSISFINNIALPDVGIPPVDKSSITTTHLIVDHNLWAANAAGANPYGTNTIAASPSFVSSSNNPLLADFRLQSSSAAINAGTHNYAPLIDKDGYVRYSSDSIDVGCYEFQVTTGFDFLYDLSNTIWLYPNPAQQSVNISFHSESPPNSFLNYCIIDMFGKTVTKGILNTSSINVSELANGV